MTEIDEALVAEAKIYEIDEQDLMSLERIYEDAKGLQYQSTFASRVYASLFHILAKHLDLDGSNN